MKSGVECKFVVMRCVLSSEAVRLALVKRTAKDARERSPDPLIDLFNVKTGVKELLELLDATDVHPEATVAEFPGPFAASPALSLVRFGDGRNAFLSSCSAGAAVSPVTLYNGAPDGGVRVGLLWRCDSLLRQLRRRKPSTLV